MNEDQMLRFIYNNFSFPLELSRINDENVDWNALRFYLLLIFM